jgi:anti-sigma regulatory factor (Ser/Thr protein kinase)
MSVPAVISPTSEQLTVRGEATAESAAQLRESFGAWLVDRGVSNPQRTDILMAVNEALANCVDHAYSDRTTVGSMAVRADYETTDMCLSVCVTDHGTWRQPGGHRPQERRRGRGVALMHALTDHCTINGRHDGTTVCLDYRCS